VKARSPRRLPRIVGAFVGSLLVAYVVYWTILHRTIVYTIPCDFRDGFFIAFNDPDGSAPDRSTYWRYELELGEEGLARVAGSPVEGGPLYYEIREECQPPRATPVEWRYSVGRRNHEGRALFDYTCFSLLEGGDASYCNQKVEEIYRERVSRSSADRAAVRAP
jgi:hypothetical protein